MPKKQQSHHWILTSVAAALLLLFSMLQLDSTKFDQVLKTQFQQSGIQLQAKNISLSWMYLGSLRFDDVAIKSDAFKLTAQRLFIDLDLAALLTGKAIAQAFYVQLADITILQTAEDAWLKNFVSPHFKLKRIDISQSKIHFNEQHLTLEQADLDIRDIGKNKSPRLELRAHIGDGRIDAHGYLHLRQGKITRGFGRLRLHDIPMPLIQDYAPSSTLNGSVTTHINQDATWQSFGHLSLQNNHKNTLELRGKVTGDPQQWMNMDNMVLTIPNAGALEFSGKCSNKDSCKVSINSSNFKLSPLFHRVAQAKQPQTSSDSTLSKIHIQSTWENNVLSSSGKLDWQALDIHNSINDIHMQAGSLEFSGFKYKAQQTWQLDQARVFENHQSSALIRLQAAHDASQNLKLALSFNHTPLWLQLNQALTIFSPHLLKIDGKGDIDGTLNLDFAKKTLNNIQFKLNASAAELNWQNSFKPEKLPLQMQGKITMTAEQGLQSLHITTSLADHYANISYADHIWHGKALDLNFNTLRNQGVRLPNTLQALQGQIQGEVSLVVADQDKLEINHAKLDFSHFGLKQELFSGYVQKVASQWSMDDLNWQHGQHTALISLHQRGDFTISADQLDSKALFIMQALPFLRQGSIHSQKFNFPFGNLH
ncbi:MAG: hypothetical protein R8M45_04875, partial [Ghiorsea sp.]